MFGIIVSFVTGGPKSIEMLESPDLHGGLCSAQSIIQVQRLADQDRHK